MIMITTTATTNINSSNNNNNTNNNTHNNNHSNKTTLMDNDSIESNLVYATFWSVEYAIPGLLTE